MKRSFMVAPMVVLLIVASVLTLSACASTPSAAPTTAPAKTTSGAAPTAASSASAAAKTAPKYGGTLNLSYPSDPSTFDIPNQGNPFTDPWEAGQSLWEGDWTKGLAGGYGTKETDWAFGAYDLFSMKAGFIAESWQINADSANQEGTIVYKIRPGVHYAINPVSDISKKINGRTVTAQDVITSIKQQSSDPRGYIYRGYPQLRKLDPQQTGPMEVTVKVPLADLVTAVSALGSKMRIFPTEIRSVDTANWKNYVGTGPFMMTDYQQGSSITMKRNPNYWMKDPIGPGKGNQLPYLDGYQLLIIRDASTRLTAFRTAKIDEIDALSWEDAGQLKKEFPQMHPVEGNYYAQQPTYMRTDRPPFNDLRVRQALVMATDFNAIKQDINGGNGVIITYPFELLKGYEDAYVSIDDKDLLPAVKDMFTYNPDKAKQLLAEAGFPNGLKTSVLIMPSDQSYYEAIASMWKKAGINLDIQVKDPPAVLNILNSKASYDQLISPPAKAPVTSYFVGSTLTGAPGFSNPSRINDPKIEDYLAKIRLAAATDTPSSLKLARQMAMYVISQAYVVNRPSYRTLTFWWPWIKNYSGELSVGFLDNYSWNQFVWLDQDLKKSMGH